MDKFRPVHDVERKASMWIHVVRRSDLQKFRQHSGPSINGQKFGRICRDAFNKKKKQNWAVEKPKLDNARKLKGIYFIEPGDMEFKAPTENARKKFGSASGIRYALQRYKQARRNSARTQYFSQNTTRTCRGSPRKNETAYWKDSTQRS